MKRGAASDKSFAFAVEIVKVCRALGEEKHEYVLSRQLLKSGTAIGALIREAQEAESKPDFIHKMAIALKESRETEYWLDLLHQSDLLSVSSFQLLSNSNSELTRLLTSILKTSKQ